MGAGYAPDAVDLRVEGGKLVAVRSIYSNNILVDVSFSSPVQVASLRPRSFPMPEAGAPAGAVKAVDAGVSEDQVGRRWSRPSPPTRGEISLTDASKIVSGGRGVAQDPAKGFALITELAGAIGAAVGASRAAVDAGFIPYKYQVGQTGKTVKPDLYIAVRHQRRHSAPGGHGQQQGDRGHQQGRRGADLREGHLRRRGRPLRSSCRR